uniref:E2F/DP family winged-helix DNA-binding domain-containing protein n=1 Tax=Acrobeloides nanus TaxID=290746 RepID=A0A914EFZ1_9BILA
MSSPTVKIEVQNTEEDEFVDVCSHADENSRMSMATTASSGCGSSLPSTEPADESSQSAIDLSHHIPSSSQQNLSTLSQSSGISSKDVSKNSQNLSQNSQENGEQEAESEAEDTEQTSRKEKSLGKLCKRFLIAMCDEAKSGNDVHLETVAKKMCVEKRRIYDIVNVMEALEAMSKTNKSFYRWHGLSYLPQLMASLQKQAVQDRLPERILRVEQAMCSFTELSPVNRADTVGTLVEDHNASTSMGPPAKKSKILNFSENSHSQNYFLSEDRYNVARTQLRDRNGKNSLAHLCRRFLMVLLCNPKDKRRVSLDVASTVLIKDPESEGFEPPSRSRCRRLYDIANVLVAMGLIKKVHYLFGTKKIPLFVYCGPEPEESPTSAHTSMQEFLSRNNLLMASPISGAKFRKVPSSSSVQAQKIPHGVKRNFATIFDPSIKTGTAVLQRASTFIDLKPNTGLVQPNFARHRSEDSMHHLANMAEFVRRHSKGQNSSFEDENKENHPPNNSQINEDLPRPKPRGPRVPFGTSANYSIRVASLDPFVPIQSCAYPTMPMASASALTSLTVPPTSTNIGMLKMPFYTWPNGNLVPVQISKPQQAVKTEAKTSSYSVTSILGVSQKENVQNIENSPKAFKPVGNSSLGTLQTLCLAEQNRALYEAASSVIQRGERAFGRQLNF